MKNDMPKYVLRTIYCECLSIFKKDLIAVNINISSQTLYNISRAEMVANLDEYTSLLAVYYIKASEEKRDDDIIRTIFAYIENNYKNYDFTLSKTAEVFHMSQSNFSHYFTRKAGYSFLQYVNLLKVKSAKELLNNTNMTIINIAKELGYDTDTAFSKMFKKQTSLTPGRYRTQNTIK